MAKKNPADILTCDWNPIIGCNRASKGCTNCWFIDQIFGWQQRLGNIPADWRSNEHHVFTKRLTEENLRPKKGIVGVVQHGDLFWNKVPTITIHTILDIVDNVAEEKKKKGDTTKYVLWTKRTKRMADILNDRYGADQSIPPHYGCATSVENQRWADERLPHLLRINGNRFVMMEPILGPIDLGNYLDVHWLVVGSETGVKDAADIDLNWIRALRDVATTNNIPFFVKQLGKSHKSAERFLDGKTWDEFPSGFVK